MLYVSGTQEPHSRILMTGVPSDLFGSEILDKSDFFWIYEYERHRDFLGSGKKKKLQKMYRDFFECAKKCSDFFGYTNSDVVIFFWYKI